MAKRKPPGKTSRTKKVTAKVKSTKKSQKHTRSPSGAPETPFATAETMAQAQRDISVSEFFAKNRHLLGFDNPRKALLTCIKEAVDNSLDACEEAGIRPQVAIGIEQLSEDRFRITIADNGPGIVKAQIPNIFGKLLYGSKFHRLRMSRGQQGIGISAAGMYGLLTTGKAMKITSRTPKQRRAHYYEIQIDTRKNLPEIIRDEEVKWDRRKGTEVVIEIEGRYQRGKQSVDEYLKQTAIANPHVSLTYTNPTGQTKTYERASTRLPAVPRSIRPHPYGVELGVLIKMLKDTKSRTLKGFLHEEFSRVSPRVAQQICDEAKLYERARPTRVARKEADNLYAAVKRVRIMNPSTDCLSPIGEDQIVKGLKNVINADMYAAVTRPPTVYRGNPFQVEVGIAYGGDLVADDLIRVLRFANRVPLLYQQSGCAIYRGVVSTSWRNYRLSQSRGALPSGPAVMMVHVASVWVPFTSESKEAVAHYPEIIREIKLGLQECGRKMSVFINKRRKQADERKKRDYIETYIPAIAEALKDILKLKEKETKQIVTSLRDVLERTRAVKIGDRIIEPDDAGKKKTAKRKTAAKKTASKKAPKKTGGSAPKARKKAASTPTKKARKPKRKPAKAAAKKRR